MLVSSEVLLLSNAVYFSILGGFFLFAGYLHPIKNIVNINYKNTGKGGSARTKTNILYYSSLGVCAVITVSLILSLAFLSRGFTIILSIVWFMLEIGYLSAAASRLRIVMALKKRNSKNLNVAFWVVITAVFIIAETVSLLFANIIMAVLVWVAQRRAMEMRNLPINTPPPAVPPEYRELIKDANWS